MITHCANCGKEIEISAEAADILSKPGDIVQIRPLCNDCGEQAYAEQIAKYRR